MKRRHPSLPPQRATDWGDLIVSLAWLAFIVFLVYTFRH